jgi:hypothetical protein
MPGELLRFGKVGHEFDVDRSRQAQAAGPRQLDEMHEDRPLVPIARRLDLEAPEAVVDRRPGATAERVVDAGDGKLMGDGGAPPASVRPEEDRREPLESKMVTEAPGIAAPVSASTTAKVSGTARRSYQIPEGSRLCAAKRLATRAATATTIIIVISRNRGRCMTGGAPRDQETPRQRVRPGVKSCTRRFRKVGGGPGGWARTQTTKRIAMTASIEATSIRRRIRGLGMVLPTLRKGRTIAPADLRRRIVSSGGPSNSRAARR